MFRLHYIALIALLMLASCSADYFAEQDTGMGSAIGSAVKTQFTLSIPTLFQPQTRMSASEVMNEPTDFTGMQDIRIFPFVTYNKDNTGEYTVTQTTAFSGFNKIGESADNRIPGFDATTLQHRDKANDKWYADLNIPSGTNSMLIYGKVLNNSNNNFVCGSVTATFSMKDKNDTPADNISFALTPVYNHENALQSQPEATLLLSLLNNILNAHGYETADGELTAWANGNNLLTATYNDFTTLRAGSSLNILKVLENLYNACAQTIALGILSAPDGEQTLPEAIQAAITSKTVAGNMCAQLIAKAPENSNSGYSLSWKTTDDCVDPAFPSRYNMPDGTVQLTYSPSATIGNAGSFDYNTFATQYGSYTLDYTKLAYPCELWFRSNTAIRTSQHEQHENVGTQTWAQFINSCYDNDSRRVEVTSKSIAAVKPLQYAVARLDSYVHFASGTIYARDAKAPTDDSKQQPVVIPTEGFRITGLLIGNQPSSLTWEFSPTTDVTQMTVLDRIMTNMVGTTATDIGISNTYAKQSAVQTTVPFTRTLLFETKGVPSCSLPVEADVNDETVNIAIEMENNGTQAFYGEDGLIPVGARFYMIATLRLSDNDTEANERNIKSIFKQDHITVANATIYSLKHAFNTIPNLTVPAQELGVSIDLQWKDGPIIETTIK